MCAPCTAQWALDCREDIPPVREVRARLMVVVDEMIEGARQFATESRKAGCADVLCLHRSAVGIEDDSRIRELGHPALILTSPPYPGVHVLYHRWQVLGRRETPAPFWIAGTLDGAGASYYTFGDRKNVPRYYEVAREAFTSVAGLCSRKTVVAQMSFFRTRVAVARLSGGHARLRLQGDCVPRTGEPRRRSCLAFSSQSKMVCRQDGCHRWQQRSSPLPQVVVDR